MAAAVLGPVGVLASAGLASGLLIFGLASPSISVANTPQCQARSENGAITLHVQSGVLCPFQLGRSGLSTAATELAKPPRAGSALIDRHAHVIYRSDRGFRGTDEFEIGTQATTGSSSGGGTMTRVSVVVD